MRKNYNATTNRLRKSHDKYTLSRKIERPDVQYNGGYSHDEDPADYIRVNYKVVRLA